MAKLNADESKLLDELLARRDAPDDDDGYEVEIYDTNAGKGARVPFKSAKGWLFDTFGIGDAPATAAGDGEGGGEPAAPGSPSAGGGKAPKGGSGSPSGGRGPYFGR